MNEFWNLVARVELLWNSPLRVEVLRILATTIFFVLGIIAGRLWGMWRRYRQLKTAERGESEDVVTIEKMILDRLPDGQKVLRIRSCGRDPMDTIFPNPAALTNFSRERAGRRVCSRWYPWRERWDLICFKSWRSGCVGIWVTGTSDMTCG